MLYINPVTELDFITGFKLVTYNLRVFNVISGAKCVLGDGGGGGLS